MTRPLYDDAAHREQHGEYGDRCHRCRRERPYCECEPESAASEDLVAEEASPMSGPATENGRKSKLEGVRAWAQEKMAHALEAEAMAMQTQADFDAALAASTKAWKEWKRAGTDAGVKAEANSVARTAWKQAVADAAIAEAWVKTVAEELRDDGTR